MDYEIICHVQAHCGCSTRIYILDESNENLEYHNTYVIVNVAQIYSVRSHDYRDHGHHASGTPCTENSYVHRYIDMYTPYKVHGTTSITIVH